MPRFAQRGLSLIELMVVLTIIGLMLMLAMPGFGNYIQNSRVRTVAEDLQNALRMAQSEAVNRNRPVAFVRTSATPAANAAPSATGMNWYIQVLPLNAVEAATTAFQSIAFVQSGSFSNESGAVVSGDQIACFNSVGRVVSSTTTGLGADCTAPTAVLTPRQFNVSLANSDRAMRVELFLAGRVRMCDVLAAAGQPQACTP